MSKSPPAKLSSEERCRQAFEEVFPRQAADTASLDHWVVQIGWNLCWRYLERNVKEFVES